MTTIWEPVIPTTITNSLSKSTQALSSKIVSTKYPLTIPQKTVTTIIRATPLTSLFITPEVSIATIQIIAQPTFSTKTLDATEATSSPAIDSKTGSSGAGMGMGIDIGVSLGLLALLGLFILMFHHGKRKDSKVEKTASFRNLSRGAWFRRSGFRKAELCAESQQIVEIGSSGVNVVKDLDSKNVVAELEGDGVIESCSDA